MEPNQQNQPVQSSQPLFNAPYQSPSPQVSPPQQTVPPTRKRSKALPILITVILLALFIAGLAVLLTSSTKKQAQPNAATTNTEKVEGPAPATPESLQAIDGSISQDIGGLNEEKDFSSDKLTDQKLSL